jgi:uncharacterized protein (TIGR03083 family)
MNRVKEAWRQRCIEAVVEEGERFGVLAQEMDDAGRLDVRVPWVPAWSALDLVGHLGTVHRWATAIVTAGHDRTSPAEEAPPADGLLDWYAEGLTGLVRALRETPADAPAWHMSPTAERVAASWARRQAHELAVHRMDLEAAAGRPHEPLDPRLAEDGVDALPKVSGKSGIHVLVYMEPGHGFARCHAYAEHVARDLAKAKPSLVTADYERKAARREEVLVDYAQNAHGKVQVGPYSVRPTPRATISMPLDWATLERGAPDPNDYTIESVPALVAKEGNRLAGWMERPQRLPK